MEKVIISEKKFDILSINRKLDIINEKLDKILLNQQDNTLNINKINKDIGSFSKNMCTHISFIENVYDNIKSPFHFILNKISKTTLPENPKLLTD